MNHDVHCGLIYFHRTPPTRGMTNDPGEQVAQWDFQNSVIRTSSSGPAFVLEVALRNLLTSM